MKDYIELFRLMVEEHGIDVMRHEEVVQVIVFPHTDWRRSLVNVSVSVMYQGRRISQARLFHSEDLSPPTWAWLEVCQMLHGTLRRMKGGT